MKVSKRSLTIYLLSTVMLLCLLLSSGLMFLNNSTAYASGESIALSSEFFVEDGASVRTQEGRSGIRFTAKIDKTYYAGKEGSWGFIIGTNLADKTNLTYDKAVDDNETSVGLYENGTSEKITLVEEDDYWVLRVKFIYDNNTLTSSEMAQKYVTNLSACAYFKDSSDNVTYAYTNDNTRSISEVAEKVLLEDALANEAIYDNADFISNRSVLEGYVINNAYSRNVEKEAYIIKDSDGFKITGIDTVFDSQSLTFNGVSIGTPSITEGELALTSAQTGDMILGNYYALSYFDQDGCVVQQPVQYITEVITNDAIDCASQSTHAHTSFNRITQLIAETYYYTGGKVYNYNPANTAASAYTSGDISLPTELPYYVLGEDVTFCKPIGAYGGNWNPIFHGVLDGKGHTITFDTVDSDKRTIGGGMFNYLSNGSQIKNTEFVFEFIEANTGSDNGNAAGAIVREFLGNNVLENVVITANKVGYLNNNATLVAGVLNNITMKDVLINVSTMESDSGKYVLGIGSKLKDGYSFENVHIVFPNYYDRQSKGGAMVATKAAINAISDDTTNYYPSGYSDTNVLEGVKVYFQNVDDAEKYSTKVADLPKTIGIWGIDTTQTVASADFAASGYASKKLELNKANYATELLKIEFKEEAYLDVNGKLSGVVNNGTYTATINGASIGEITVDNGVDEGVSVSGLTLGEVYFLELTSGSTVYLQPVQYVTEVISTNDRLSTLLGTNENSEGELPYYVLRSTSDGNFTYTKPVQNFDNSIIFHGILDGKGHSITFDTVDSNKRTLSGGMFNKLSVGSQIKNVEFVIPRYDANNSSSSLYSGALAREFLGNNVLENVVITIQAIKWQLGTEGSRPYYLLAATLNDVALNNVLINLGSIGASPSDYVFALGCDLTDASNIKNVTVIYSSAFSTNTIGEVVVASSATRSAFKDSGTLYYANNSGVEEAPFTPSVGGNPAQPAKKLISGVNVYFSNDLKDAPAKVGTWDVNASSFGKDAVATYDKRAIVADEFIVNDKTISVGDTFKVDKLVSSQGFFEGSVCFSIADTSVLSYNSADKTFTTNLVGQTTVKYSYQINGVVFVKQFTVNVVA